MPTLVEELIQDAIKLTLVELRQTIKSLGVTSLHDLNPNKRPQFLKDIAAKAGVDVKTVEIVEAVDAKYGGVNPFNRTEVLKDFRTTLEFVKMLEDQIDSVKATQSKIAQDITAAATETSTKAGCQPADMESFDEFVLEHLDALVSKTSTPINLVGLPDCFTKIVMANIFNDATVQKLSGIKAGTTYQDTDFTRAASREGPKDNKQIKCDSPCYILTSNELRIAAEQCKTCSLDQFRTALPEANKPNRASLGFQCDDKELFTKAINQIAHSIITGGARTAHADKADKQTRKSPYLPGIDKGCVSPAFGTMQKLKGVRTELDRSKSLSPDQINTFDEVGGCLHEIDNGKGYNVLIKLAHDPVALVNALTGVNMCTDSSFQSHLLSSTNLGQAFIDSVCKSNRVKQCFTTTLGKTFDPSASTPTTPKAGPTPTAESKIKNIKDVVGFIFDKLDPNSRVLCGETFNLEQFVKTTKSNMCSTGFATSAHKLVPLCMENPGCKADLIDSVLQLCNSDDIKSYWKDVVGAPFTAADLGV